MTFLDRSARNGFVWGESDCMLEVADWLDFSCGLDSAASWRGTYTSEAELDALMEPLGGFETAMRAAAESLGLEEAAEPQFGDIALVTIPGQDRPLGAILMASGRWRMKTLAGILVTREAEVLVAWKLPCRPQSPLAS